MRRLPAILISSVLAGVVGCGLFEPVDLNDNTNNNNNSPTGGISGTISHDTTWNTQGSEIVIDGYLTIAADVVWGRKIVVVLRDNAVVSVSQNGSLTIEEGVLIKNGTGSYFQVGYTSAGALIVEGSDSLPVTFTKNSGVQNWGYSSPSSGGGIGIYSYATTLTSLRNCIIEHATQGLYIDEVSPVITNCKIRNNAAMGISYDGKAAPKDSASFVGNEISGNGDYPIALSAEGVTKLCGSTIITGNAQQAIKVRPGTVTESGTWRKHSVPYHITGEITIGKATSGVTITVEPGVVCKFDTDAYLEIGYVNPATFIADGTDSNRIVFTTSTAGSYWGYDGGNIEGGIWIGDKATANTSLEYCDIEYATTGIYANRTKITVSNCRISDCTKSGIRFDNAGSPKDSASFVNDTITDNGGYAIVIDPSQLGTLSGTGSVAGNTQGGIYVEAGQVQLANSIWKKHDAPYVIAGEIVVGAATGATVTVRPGCRFLMTTDAFIEIGYTNPATFIAEGNETDSIYFLSAVEGIDWGYDGVNIEGGIWIGDKSTANTSFTHCAVESAISGFYINKASVTIKNCSIRDCTLNAVTLDNNAPQTNIADNAFANNGDDVVVVQ